MILKHDEAEPLELSSGPYGDADMESLNGRWISQTAMAPAKSGKADKGRLKRLFSPASPGPSAAPALLLFSLLFRVSLPGDV